MKKKMVLLALLFCVSFGFAGQYSVELSLYGGIQRLNIDESCFNPGPLVLEADKVFILFSAEPELSGYYKNTGLYFSASKPTGHLYFKRYWILSGGLKQRIKISDKVRLNFHIGTTWHSIDAAIHSFVMFLINTRFKSLPGLDTGIGFDYSFSEKVALFIEANYNYNTHYGYIPEPTNIDKNRTQVMSFNIGISYTLF